MKALDPHVKMICCRHFMKIFAIARSDIQFAMLHLEYADVLGFGLSIQVIFLHTSLHTIHVPFAFGNVKGITEQHPLLRRGGVYPDIQVVANLGQLFQALDRGFLLLSCHQPVIILEVLMPAQGKLFTAAWQLFSVASCRHKSGSQSSRSCRDFEEIAAAR